jgi:hypothetical protein
MRLRPYTVPYFKNLVFPRRRKMTEPIEPDDEQDDEGEGEDGDELVESWETEDQSVIYELHRGEDGYELLVFSEQFDEAPPGDGGIEGEKDPLSFCLATSPGEIDEIIKILTQAKQLMK